MRPIVLSFCGPSSNTMAHCFIILEILSWEASLHKTWGTPGPTWSAFPGVKGSGPASSMRCFLRLWIKNPHELCASICRICGYLSDAPFYSPPPHGKWMLCIYPQGGQNKEWWQYHVGNFADFWCTQRNCWNVLYSFGIINKTRGLDLPGTWPCRLCSSVCGVPKLTPK